jgi:superfamily I DNA/RNA helicase
MTTTYEEILSNLSSPTLVLAGPGAGKTYLLADGVKRLLEGGTDKNSIRVLAFGKDAARQMYDKLVDREGFGLDPHVLPRITTMHALGLEIVSERPRAVGLRKSGLAVQADKDIKGLIFRDAALILGLPDEAASEARKCKETGDCTENPQRTKCKICGKYWQIMSKCNRVDFDDQILFACRILESDADLLAEYQAQCEHLLVDEYQDINAAQFRLIELLSRQSRNGLLVVGDDAQSIYSFRGASPQFILSFRDSFPSARTPPLAQSRRCHSNTMNDAVRVLSEYYAEWAGPYDLTYHSAPGEPPSVWQLPSEIAEAKMVARVARRFLSDNDTVLVLVPKREFFPLISKALRDRRVPHDCPVNLLSKSANTRFAAARAFLLWVKSPRDNFLARVAIEECINRGVAKVVGASRGSRCRPETIKFRVEVESEIARLWESVDRKTNLYGVLQTSEEGSESLRKIRSVLAGLLDAYGSRDRGDAGQFVKLLAVQAGVWPSSEDLAEDLLSVMSIMDSPHLAGPRNVQVMTMRKAKGLEADVVMMVGLEDDIVPGQNCEDISEAARLFYVSMTRAKKKLFLFHSFKRPRNVSYGDDLTHKPRSRFLDAIGRPSEFKKPKH